MMTEDQDIQIIKEIMDYCKNENNWSYYDMKAYAFLNKPKWIEALRKKNIRTIIALYLRSAKKESGTPYKTSMADSLSNCSEAATKYYETVRQNWEN